MPTAVIQEHPCEICKKPTTNPNACSRVCSCKLARKKSSASNFGPRPHRRKSVKDRFLNFIPNRPDNNECWVWIGAHSRDGYPLIWDSDTGTQLYAHRVAYEIFRGPIPKGHVVSQVCENPECTNPKHLVCGPRGKIVGSRLHRSQKTARYGDRNASSRLTDAEVIGIRQLHSEHKFKEIRAIAAAKKVNPEYALAVGRSKGRRRKNSYR